MVELLRALTSSGYGIHLFEPKWFAPKTGEEKKKPFKSPTVIPEPAQSSKVHGLDDACSDDALWLVPSVIEYVRETGDFAFLDTVLGYADGGTGTVYEHLQKILQFSNEQIGKHGICKGLRADWNDCLNLGGGESALVSFLHYDALKQFISLASYLQKEDDVRIYTAMSEKVHDTCENQLWDGEWYIRGFTSSGRKIGTAANTEGKVHLESNAWAVLSGCASEDRSEKSLQAIHQYLSTPYGIMLNAPAYTVPDDEVGFVTRVYPGLKENGSVFSHPNPWVWAAECRMHHGNAAMDYYHALTPYYQNDRIEIRQAEPYSYCQFISGVDHSTYGRAHHPFMTGSGGWAYYAATHWMLGIRPDYDHLTVDPCIPSSWNGFRVTRKWRNAEYCITVGNPDHKESGVSRILLDGKQVDRIPLLSGRHEVTVIM